MLTASANEPCAVPSANSAAKPSKLDSAYLVNGCGDCLAQVAQTHAKVAKYTGRDFGHLS
jgi:hypothetical protein